MTDSTLIDALLLALDSDLRGDRVVCAAAGTLKQLRASAKGMTWTDLT
jgi:hypothetical protein